ncbi:SSI family serine proteinase inhibitor [Streptomyces sp. NPDC053427]|uniref:SSI family serine proteinase inhibitor n=1 Tax=Streptomyces sp. NPDC053427 TaxID=3365701 RepID=UPI0037D64DF5
MPYRRTYPGMSLLAAAATVAVSLVGAAPALAAAPIPLPVPLPIPLSDHRAADSGLDVADALFGPLPAHRAAADRLTVTVSASGTPGTGRTFELRCHPDGGNHPDATRACDKLDELTRWGRDTFAAVPPGAHCTMIYGSPATAHVTGTWAGRPVDARFRRTNGCEIARWNRFEPLLPRPTS